MGRFRLRFLGDVEDDLRELKVKRWKKKTNNREEWTPVVKEVKVLIVRSTTVSQRQVNRRGAISSGCL